eukprot:Pgem_evm1s6650
MARELGVNFQTHGGYNAIVWFAIFTPINLIIGLNYIVICRYGLTGYFRKLALLLVAFLVILQLGKIYYTYKWVEGFYSERIDNQLGQCRIDTNGEIPLLDFLPNGIQNFWAGGWYCDNSKLSFREEQFRAIVTMDNKLVITGTCLEAQQTFYLDIKEKTDFSVYQYLKEQPFIKQVRETMKEKAYNHQQHHDGVLVEGETIVVKCGAFEKVLLNLRPSSGVFRRSKNHFLTAANVNNSVNVDPEIDVLNIRVIFVDAVGRRQFFRKMTSTARTMEKL